jgi:uncharacterized protein YlxP (DUF503 family)
MAKAKNLIREAIDTGEFGDFIDPSHKRRIAGHRSPGMPDEHASVLASQSYQEAVRKLARYTGITPRSQRDLMQVSGMMMQALQQVSQIEQGHEQELEQAAVNLVLSLPEFKSAKDAFEAGEIRIRAELTANINLQAARVDAEDTTNREELKIAQIAQELDLEVQKRRMINMMIQGNAMNKMQAFHMAQEQLNQIDPRLMNLYGVLTSVGEFSYWIFPEMMQKQGMEERGGAGGAAHVGSGEDGVPEIVAQGITFPMLVHELVKALMEYVSYDEDMDPETRAHVSGQADTLDNELDDIKLGPSAWRSIIRLIPDQELVPYVYDFLVRLPATQFHETMRLLLAGGPAAERKIQEIVRQINDQRAQEESVPDVIVRNLLN